MEREKNFGSRDVALTPVTLRIEKERMTDALLKAERVLRDQAGIEIVRATDGSLSARRVVSRCGFCHKCQQHAVPDVGNHLACYRS